MSDCNSHTHNHKKNTRALSYAFWLNLIFSIIELIGGLLTNSTAVITDALHDFMDAFAIGMAVLLEKLSGKPANQSFTYGFKRFSLLSAICMSLFLLVGAAAMISSAITSFLHPEPVHSLGMLGLAILGALVNGAAFFNIKNGGGHSHAHSACGHGHGHNQNSQAIMLHLLEDLLGWVAVLVGAIVIYFTDWYWVDGLLAIGIAAFIIINAIKNIISCMKVLLMATPSTIDIDNITSKITAIDERITVEKLHVWSLDGAEHVANIHIAIPECLTQKSVKRDVKQLLQDNGIHEVSIDIEWC